MVKKRRWKRSTAHINFANVTCTKQVNFSISEILNGEQIQTRVYILQSGKLINDCKIAMIQMLNDGKDYKESPSCGGKFALDLSG